MKQKIALIFGVTLILSAGAVALMAVPSEPTASGTQTTKCYEQVTESQYKKFTAPTSAGPWVLYGTWWQGQTGAWWPGDAEVVEGPAPHPDGSYTYRQVDERVVNGEEIPCPTTTTSTTTTTTLVPGVVTPTVLYTPPTCTSIGTLTFPESPNYTVTNNGNGTFTFVANPGSVFPPGFVATVGPFPTLQLIGEQCTSTTTSTTSTTTTTTTTTTLPGSTTTTTQPPAAVPFTFGAAATVCVAEVPTIRITFLNTFPELAGRTGTLTMSALNGGAVVSTQPLVYRPGTTVDILYPGTRVNPDGTIADVPGWNLNSSGLWVRDPSDAFLRDGIALSYTVNPTATALVTYPPESANCSNPENPPPGLTPPPPGPGLPSTE
jgi:hypothetical protein